MTTAATATRPAPTALHAAIERDRAPGERIYAIIDAARDPHLARSGFEQFELERYSLFPTRTSPQMAAVAPYLVPVPFAPKYPFAESGFFDLWASRFGGSAGVLLGSAAELRDVWEHLQDAFLVTDEAGSEFYFRYYDPRVLRAFLPSLEGAEARQFFGPVRRFYVEADGGAGLLVARATDAGVAIDRRPLRS
jgi:hypothetical protein